MFGEQSRLSKISDRNIYLRTDMLYEPLRNVLRKSTISSSQRISEPSPVKLGRNIRSLSPAQGELIKSNLFIPINKELVATDHVHKIAGKRFTAVDVSQKVGDPIGPMEFSAIKQGTVQEIVYQLKEDEPRNIYTSRMSIMGPQVQSRVVTQRRSISPGPTIYFRTTSPAPLKHNNSIVVPTMNPFKSSKPEPQPEKQVKAQPLMSHNRKQIFPYELVTSATALRSSDNASFKSQNSKLYDFRSSNASFKDIRRRQNYKYNLFSVIDEPGNMGCQNGCWHGNEIVASKIDSNPWK